MIKTLTDSNFDELVKSEPIILVDFWAEWCGPCKMMLPVLEEISNEGNISVGKLNVDEHSIKPSEYSVQAIPTMVLFVDGNPVHTIVGAMPKHKLLKELAPWI
jgi:thioredoxin 1